MQEETTEVRVEALAPYVFMVTRTTRRGRSARDMRRLIERAMAEQNEPPDPR